MIQGITDFIDTEFCLTVQWDGFGLFKQNWLPQFLEYDYIGAPWPAHMNPARVGNGGFSLRSKRWLDAAANPFDAPPYSGEVEDDWACHQNRSFYESKGCKIAPLHVAARFSIEWPVEEYPSWTIRDCFGFHGHFTPETALLRQPTL